MTILETIKDLFKPISHNPPSISLNGRALSDENGKGLLTHGEWNELVRSELERLSAAYQELLDWKNAQEVAQAQEEERIANMIANEKAMTLELRERAKTRWADGTTRKESL